MLYSLCSFDSSYRSRRKGYGRPGPDAEEEGAEESSEEEGEVMDESVPSQSSVSSAPNILEFEGCVPRGSLCVTDRGGLHIGLDLKWSMKYPGLDQSQLLF